MPSNQEIENAINDAITSDNTIDLLLISSTLDGINGEVISTDEDYGMHYNYLYIGMSGQKFVDQMNSNLHATDAQFLAHHNALNLRIKSNQIKEIKVENNVVYYTTQNPPLDGEEDTRTWVSLQASWGNIAGNLTDQEDLVEALADKVSVDTFNDLESRVSVNEDNILTIQRQYI